MSKNELARLRKHALYTGAADPVVVAFESAHKARASKARVTRRKAKAVKPVKAKAKKAKAKKAIVAPLVQTPEALAQIGTAVSLAWQAAQPVAVPKAAGPLKTWRYAWPNVEGTVSATNEKTARAMARAKFGLTWLPDRSTFERVAA